MKYEWIDNWSDFRKLAPEWNQLLSHSACDTIFLTWEWVSSCGPKRLYEFVSRAIVKMASIIFARNDTAIVIRVALSMPGNETGERPEPAHTRIDSEHSGDKCNDR